MYIFVYIHIYVYIYISTPACVEKGGGVGGEAPSVCLFACVFVPGWVASDSPLRSPNPPYP